MKRVTGKNTCDGKEGRDPEGVNRAVTSVEEKEKVGRWGRQIGRLQQVLKTFWSGQQEVLEPKLPIREVPGQADPPFCRKGPTFNISTVFCLSLRVGRRSLGSVVDSGHGN